MNGFKTHLGGIWIELCDCLDVETVREREVKNDSQR